jgi:hypothetical protein
MNLSHLLAAPVAAALLALAPPAAAAPQAAPAAPAPAAEPSAAAKELARQLVPKPTWDTGVQQISTAVKARLEGHPGSQLKYPADLAQKIRAEVEAALPYDELIGMHARELTASYSEAELKEVSGFFKTPAGKKWLEASPRSAEKVTLETQRRFEQKMPEIMTKMSKLAKTADGKDAKKGAEKADAKRAEEAKKGAAHPAK